MSKQTTIKSARDQFLEQFNILSGSAIGVVLVRSREPHRAEDALKVWAFDNERSFRSWNAVRGWLEGVPESPRPTTRPVPDRTVDPYAALKRINDVDGGGTNAWTDSLCVMHYPHWYLPKHPGMMQCLKEYVREFSETRQRLALLVPEGFVLPLELQNDVVVLDFDLPSRPELLEIYHATMESAQESSGHKDKYTEAQIETLLASGGGMTEMEWETALSKAVTTYKSTWPNVPLTDFNQILLDAKTEVIKRSEVLELMPPVTMEEVGGMDLVKEWISLRRDCFTQAARDYGVDVPKGICAIGPPGTGKTLLGKAIASTLRHPLIRFDISRVFGGIVGQSEERVRSALKQVDAMAPCTVMIDEIDKAGIDPRQGGGDSGVSKRVMGAILTHMQETKAKVFWVLTANRVDGLPPELLRKGRLDEVFALLPPNRAERMEVLRIHLAKRKQDPGTIKGLDKVVARSEGFVSAELEAAVKEAVVHSYMHKTPITSELLIAQLDNMKPISEAFPEDFARMREWAENNARMASTPEEVATVAPTFRSRTRRRQLGA